MIFGMIWPNIYLIQGNLETLVSVSRNFYWRGGFGLFQLPIYIYIYGHTLFAKLYSCI